MIGPGLGYRSVDGKSFPDLYSTNLKSSSSNRIQIGTHNRIHDTSWWRMCNFHFRGSNIHGAPYDFRKAAHEQKDYFDKVQ